jgi:uncharacterized phiE125 gp8 family phage protein
MKTTLKTAPAKRPLTLNSLKNQLYIVADDSYDDHLYTLIDTATVWIEQYLCRKLISQTWYAYFDKWPDTDYIEIPFGNLQSVTAVKYTDTDESESTFSSADYLVDTDSIPGRVVLKYGETWPTVTLSPSNPIEIEFVTGYGDDVEDIPASVLHAMKMLCSQHFEHREPQEITNMINIHSLDFGTKTLLYPHRVWRWAA